MYVPKESVMLKIHVQNLKSRFLIAKEKENARKEEEKVGTQGSMGKR